jgi:hypothetical protein
VADSGRLAGCSDWWSILHGADVEAQAMMTTNDGGPLNALRSGFAWAAKRSFHSGAAGSASSDDQTVFSYYVQQYFSYVVVFMTTGPAASRPSRLMWLWLSFANAERRERPEPKHWHRSRSRLPPCSRGCTSSAHSPEPEELS